MPTTRWPKGIIGRSKVDATTLLEKNPTTRTVSSPIGDQTIEATPGTFAFVPRGVEHGFRLESAEAKLLLLLTPGDAGHEDLFTEMGEPAGAHEVPPPPDVEGLAAIAARHGTRIVGPPVGMEE